MYISGFSIKVDLLGNELILFMALDFKKNIISDIIGNFRKALFSKNLTNCLLWKKILMREKKTLDKAAFTGKSKSFNF